MPENPFNHAPVTPTPPGHRLLTAEVLNRYTDLDDLDDPAFDDLARLAATVCRTPIALIGFIDGSRQRFKSRIGIEFSECSLETGFCSLVLESGKPLIVSNALADPRFSNNPAVTGDLSVRCYAGVPLVTSENVTIGTL